MMEQSREPEPEPEPEHTGLCCILCAGSPVVCDEPPLSSGCACKSLLHWECVASVARRSPRAWLECTQCGIEWGADMNLRLATERYHRAKNVGNVEWVCSAMELSRALQKRGEYTEALRIGSEALPEMCRVLGTENVITINAIRQVA